MKTEVLLLTNAVCFLFSYKEKELIRLIVLPAASHGSTPLRQYFVCYPLPCISNEMEMTGGRADHIRKKSHTRLWETERDV